MGRRKAGISRRRSQVSRKSLDSPCCQRQTALRVPTSVDGAPFATAVQIQALRQPARHVDPNRLRTPSLRGKRLFRNDFSVQTTPCKACDGRSSFPRIGARQKSGGATFDSRNHRARIFTMLRCLRGGQSQIPGVHEWSRLKPAILECRAYESEQTETDVSACSVCRGGPVWIDL